MDDTSYFCLGRALFHDELNILRIAHVIPHNNTVGTLRLQILDEVSRRQFVSVRATEESEFAGFALHHLACESAFKAAQAVNHDVALIRAESRRVLERLHIDGGGDALKVDGNLAHAVA